MSRVEDGFFKNDPDIGPQQKYKYILNKSGLRRNFIVVGFHNKKYGMGLYW